jgi:uncharacterized protein (TIGR01777 family)
MRRQEVDVARVVIAGGTGSLGRRLADDLAARGHEIVVLTRSPRPDAPHRQLEWDGRTAGPWSAELEGSVLVNLAGALVDRRPTAANVELLRRSRLEPTLALVEAARRAAVPPSVWIQMSTLAIYGDAGQEVLVDGHPPADGPPQMAGVARPWEEAAQEGNAGRQVVLRTGIVLDRGSPAYDRLVRLARRGLGGRIGDGRQWVSWIHVDDFLAAVRFVLDDDSMSGVVHVTSPVPVQNRELMAAVRRHAHRPWSPPTPRLLVRLGARAMGSDPALALTGRRAVPHRLVEAGFAFRQPDLDGALADLGAGGA